MEKVSYFEFNIFREFAFSQMGQSIQEWTKKNLWKTANKKIYLNYSWIVCLKYSFFSFYEWPCVIRLYGHTFKEPLKVSPLSFVFQVWFNSTNTISSLIFVLSPLTQDCFHLLLTWYSPIWAILFTKLVRFI